MKTFKIEGDEQGRPTGWLEREPELAEHRQVLTGDDRPCVMHAVDDCSPVLPCALCPASSV